MKKNRSDKTSAQFVLLRGLARESRHWGEFPVDLKNELAKISGLAPENIFIDAIDLPGAGKFSEMKSPISIPEITEFVRTKFYELRQSRRSEGGTPSFDTYLVAISLGGMVATEWLHHWPDDFAGCVLINTSFRGYSTLTQRLKPANWLSLARLLREKEALRRESEVLKLVSNRAEKREATARLWAKISLSRPISLENFARQLIAATRFQVAATPPPVQILVVSSSADRFVDPECSKVIAERWNVPWVTHPDAGHDLCLDEPVWLAQQIAKWWASARQRLTE